MKQGKTLSELAAELDRQAKTKRDFVVPSELMKYHASPANIEIVGMEDFTASGLFQEQLATHLEVPRKYWDKMSAQAPELLETNVNHWLQRSGKEKRNVRTLDGQARAFLSERYRALDNYDLAEVVLPELTKSGCRIESCEVTEKRFYLKAVTERVQYEVKKNDVVQAGIVISNSEVGCGSLRIEPLLLRLVCLNGMIMPDSAIRKYHVGRGTKFDFEGAIEFYKDETRLADDRALWLKVRDTVAAAFNQIDFQKMVAKFSAAANDKIENEPAKVIELSQRKFGISETEGGGVLAHLIAGGDMSKFGLANAFTRHAQDIKSYDRATEFERIGGEIIELPRTHWDRIAVAA